MEYDPIREKPTEIPSRICKKQGRVEIHWRAREVQQRQSVARMRDIWEMGFRIQSRISRFFAISGLS
jgi:hypothetical protein